MKDELVALLDDILPLARFRILDIDLDLQAYQNLYDESYTYAGIQRVRPWYLIHAEVNVDGVPEPMFERLVEAFRCVLGSYINPKNSRVAFAAPSIVGGGMYPQPDIHRFARQAVRCAALAGSASTVELLLGWIEGEPVHYTQMMVLQGVRQEQECFYLQPGVRFMQLSRDDSLYKMIPEELALKSIDSSIETRLAGATVLCVDETARPAIYKPDDVKHVCPGGNRQSSLCHPPGRLLQALSLACDSPVNVIHSWVSFDSEFAFLTGCHNQPRSWSPRWSVGSVALTQQHLDRAWDLCEKLGKQPNTELQVAIHRWMKSKPLLDLVNDSIDVRIALEALFHQGGENTELSLRLALRGAWYLGNDESERAKYFRTLKKAYDTCSKAVHTGYLKGETSTICELLTDAQDICRKTLLKRLDEGRAPDWTALVLGA